MATENPLTQSMNKAVKLYSLLFRLPSHRKVLMFLALSCVSVGLLSSTTLSPSFDGLVNGILLGSSLFSTNLILDYLVSAWILRQDPIYDLRRTMALSLFSWILWLASVLVGVAFAITFSSSWLIKFSLLGFSSVLILRLIVFNATSSVSHERLLLASFLHPYPCVVPFLLFWAGNDLLLPSTLPFLLLSLVLCFLSSSVFILLLNRVGKQAFGIPSISLFKAFLLNWIVGLNAPFEELLEALGEEKNVDVLIMRFDAAKPKAIMIIPSIHPGPFKNVGSSSLPSMLKATLEEKLNCVACVPHSLLGHELDLASQAQNQKVITRITESANFEGLHTTATPFIKTSNGLATACCQIFGDFAFLSFTLAPKTTEDLPQELGSYVRQEAENHRLTNCVAVNAHNSINGTTNVEETLGSLKKVAATCLERANSLNRSPFEIGVATAAPKGFSLEDGMGPGGITTMVTKVKGQKTAYVVIDGNNMVSGLREKIMSALHSTGIDESEVFTTDTHAVNALILGERGYSPVGEVIDPEKLIRFIVDVTLSALSNLEPVKATCRSLTIHNVKVIGAKKLETLCIFINKTLQKAKRLIILILAFTGLLLILFLIFA